MKNRRNYYRVLHVQPDAPREVIRSSYRTMMQKMRMHPDMGGDNQNAAVLNEAYSILADSEHRAAYDKSQVISSQARVYKKAEAETNYSPSVHPGQCAFCGFSHQLGGQNRTPAFCGNCQSPLHLSEQSHIEDRDRRTIMRVPNNQSLMFCTHWPQSEPCCAQADDISLSGMKFHSCKRLQLGQTIKIESQVLRAVARVTHCRKRVAGWATGVQFLSLCFEQSRGAFISGRV